jgi:hypothetical protein
VLSVLLSRPRSTGTFLFQESAANPNANFSLIGQCADIHIEYDPSGIDEGDEYVRLDNLSGRNATMTYWTTCDDANHIFTFPHLRGQPGCPLKFGRTTAVTTIPTSIRHRVSQYGTVPGTTLRNNIGQVIDVCVYSGGGCGRDVTNALTNDQWAVAG